MGESSDCIGKKKLSKQNKSLIDLFSFVMNKPSSSQLMSDQEISIERRIELLRTFEAFRSLEESALNELATMLTEKRTRPQEPVFRKGDVGREFYIIAEGEVRVHDGNHVITRLHEGDVFGEYALIDQNKRSASVTTEKPCLFLVLNSNGLMPFMMNNPGLLVGILLTQVRRMREMNDLEDKLSKSYLKISKQKQEIEEQHQSIKEQKNQLEEQNAQLIELNENKKKLVSILIHGLKNPLTSAMMMSDLIAQLKTGDKELAEYNQILKQSLLRMDEVFNSIIAGNQKEELS
jgi:CRP-like cAMP-binding protein